MSGLGKPVEGEQRGRRHRLLELGHCNVGTSEDEHDALASNIFSVGEDTR